jgi:hypothetical protein
MRQVRGVIVKKSNSRGLLLPAKSPDDGSTAARAPLGGVWVADSGDPDPAPGFSYFSARMAS